MIDHERTRQTINELLNELEHAVGELKTQWWPQAPMPRPRIFRFADRVTWPYTRKGRIIWFSLKEKNNEVTLHEAASAILLHLRSPRDVIKCIQTIRSAIKWCRKRAEGRRRHSEEIYRQQIKIVGELEKIYAASKLAE